MRRIAEEAIVLDPQYSNAYSLLGLSHAMDIWLKNTESPEESIRRALEFGAKGGRLGLTTNASHYGLGLRLYDVRAA